MSRNSRSESRRLAAVLLALAVAGLAPGRARGQTVDTTATVLISGRADPRDGKVYSVVPIYESLSVGASDFKLRYLDDFKIVLQGWSMQQLGSARPDINFDVSRPFPNQGSGSGNSRADVDLGFVEGKVLWRRVSFRLGRQLVSGGAARVTQLDGLDLDWRIVAGLGVTVYGGVPVTPRLSWNRGDAAVGGRIYYRFKYDTEIGVSAIDVLGQGRAVRQDLGADARIALHRTFYLTGYGLFSIKEMRLAEATASLNWQPVTKFLLTADYRRVAPDLFLPMNSIFSVFSQETRDEVGGTVFFQPSPRLRLAGDYRAVNDSNGWGHRGGARATLLFNRGATFGLEGRALHLPSTSLIQGRTNGYAQGRVFGTERAGNFFFSLDLDAYYLESPIQNQNYSFTGAATAGWDFSPGWKLALTGIGDVTPFVDRRFEVLARLVWNQTVRIREVK